MSEPAISATGAWCGLASIFRQQAQEFDSWAATVTADGGLACPVCGEPLLEGPSTGTRSVTRFCRFAGDHRFEAPRDVVSPRHGQPMGRYG